MRHPVARGRIKELNHIIISDPSYDESVTCRYEKNNLKVLTENEKVILTSEGKIDLTDVELNDFLCSYKKVVDEKKLKISICENTKEYDY